MGESCPECGNDVYAPYTYCSSCGWEATGAQERKAKKKYEEEVSKKKKASAEAMRKRRKGKGRDDDDDEDDDDLDDDLFDDEDDLDDDRGERTKYRVDYSTGVGYRHDRGPRYHRHDRGDYRAAGEPVEYAPGEGWEPKEPTRIPCRCGADIIVHTTKRPVRIQCRSCGARAVLKGPARDRAPPSRGPPPREAPYRGRPAARRAPGGYDDTPPGRKGRGRGAPPPGRPKPTKGKCSSCGSLRLRFHDDGSGVCPDCNRRFFWDKDAEKRTTSSRGRGRGRDEDEYYCKYCDNPLTYVKMYEKWYCEYCRRYT